MAVTSTAAFALIVLGTDQSRAQFIYFVLPAQYKNPWTFAILFALESVVIIFFSSIFSFTILSQLLFFQKCDQNFMRLDIEIR